MEQTKQKIYWLNFLALKARIKKNQNVIIRKNFLI